jgi:hypothetical protein
MLETALFGIAGFLVGFFIFILLWTLPLTSPLYPRDVARNPLFWCLAIFAGLMTAVGFCVVGRML